MYINDDNAQIVHVVNYLKPVCSLPGGRSQGAGGHSDDGPGSEGHGWEATRSLSARTRRMGLPKALSLASL